MSKLIKQILILTCLVALLVLPYFVFANVDTGSYRPGETDNTMKQILEGVGATGGYNYGTTDEYTMSRIAGTAVSAFLSILGVIFIFLALYGGYTYMMARGNEEDVSKALLIIQRAIIGLIITVGVYAIWRFVWFNFLNS